MLHEDRFFDPDPTVRRIARSLHEEIAGLPLVCPHGHVDPRLLADDEPFPEPVALLLTPDHYLIRMLYSQGVPMEDLGIGEGAEGDPRRIWQRFAEKLYLFRGTPSGAWFDYQLHEVFGIEDRLDGESAQWIYDALVERLASPEMRPRALFERFGVEVLATTDDAAASLEDHRRIRASGWAGRVVPTFRPDSLFALAAPGWRDEVRRLGEAVGREITEYGGLIDALAQRRADFRALGATATDHGVLEPRTAWMAAEQVERLFARGLDGSADAADQRDFQAHLLMEMARMSAGDGMVMQLHAGALRNHNQAVHDRFGPDRGGDIPVATEFTRNLAPLLNAWGNDAAFRLILFTLDESTYSRELAPLAGHYPGVRLGPPWWFHDSAEGIRRFFDHILSAAGIYNTVGFNDDTRAFCSIPARHDLARRVTASWLAGLTARHIVDRATAGEMARAIAWELPRKAYRLDEG